MPLVEFITLFVVRSSYNTAEVSIKTVADESVFMVRDGNFSGCQAGSKVFWVSIGGFQVKLEAKRSEFEDELNDETFTFQNLMVLGRKFGVQTVNEIAREYLSGRGVVKSELVRIPKQYQIPEALKRFCFFSP